MVKKNIFREKKPFQECVLPFEGRVRLLNLQALFCAGQSRTRYSRVSPEINRFLSFLLLILTYSISVLKAAYSLQLQMCRP